MKSPEQFNQKEYRNNLAEKLKDIRNSYKEKSEFSKGKAEGYLEATQETNEYKLAKRDKLHENIVEELRRDSRELFFKYAKDQEQAKKSLEAVDRILEKGIEFNINGGYGFINIEIDKNKYSEKEYDISAMELDAKKDVQDAGYIVENGYAFWSLFDNDKFIKDFENSHAKALKEIKDLEDDLKEKNVELSNRTSLGYISGEIQYELFRRDPRIKNKEENFNKYMQKFRK